jgi:hypothetical protein
MSKQPQRAQNMQSEFSDILKQIQESRQKNVYNREPSRIL